MVFICVTTSFSMIFDRVVSSIQVDSFSAVPDPDFFMRGLTLATFRLVGKTPLLNEMLAIFVNTGLKELMHVSSICVGIGCSTESR